MADLPPADHLVYQPATAYCMVSAARRFSVPLDGLVSMLLVEGGRVGLESPNTNGSFDYGPMQINSVWLGPKSPLYGFVSAPQLRDNLCTNIHSAAWILASHMKRANDIWLAVGKYHSPYTEELQRTYMLKVNARLGVARVVVANVPAYQQYTRQFFGASAGAQPPQAIEFAQAQ